MPTLKAAVARALPSRFAYGRAGFPAARATQCRARLEPREQRRSGRRVPNNTNEMIRNVLSVGTPPSAPSIYAANNDG